MGALFSKNVSCLPARGRQNVISYVIVFCSASFFFDKMEKLLKLFEKIEAQWSREFLEYTNSMMVLGPENVLGCLPNNSNCFHKTRHLVRLFLKHCRQGVEARVLGFWDQDALPIPDLQNCSLKELIFF